MTALKTVTFLLIMCMIKPHSGVKSPGFLATGNESEQESLPMDYVIALTKSDGKEFHWTITGQFNSKTWDRLWTELGVPRKRWDEWQAARGGLVLMPELSTLSLLAHIDEGSLSLDPAPLKQECNSVLERVVDPGVRGMLEDFLQTADSALAENATVYVYPSVGESVGDTFSSKIANPRERE